MNIQQHYGNLRIDAERLWSRHMEMAKIGAIPGDGNCRLAMSAEDSTARSLFATWCADAGMSLKVDAAGNMFALRPGTDPSLPPIAAGSHLDTQPHGGRFDGISGVLAALEVVETLNDASIETRAPIAVINWTNEEGVRFGPGLMGSSWFVGNIGDDGLAAIQDVDGVSFVEEAASRGWRGPQAAGAFPMGAFFELHIEQGPKLEALGDQVGIVTSVQGLKWLDVEVTGMDGHAGTTPLDHRRDALLTAARMLVALNDIGRSFGPDARVSVGRLKTETDGPSTIVGGVRFVIDLRHPDASVLAELASQSAAICRAIATAAGCDIALSERISVAPKHFDPDCIAALTAAARHLGVSHSEISSGALHDASNIVDVTPTAMIFVPCRGGISHNVNEYASREDLAAGTSVLLQAMLAKAEVAEP